MAIHFQMLTIAVVLGVSMAGNCPSGLFSITRSHQCFKFIDEQHTWSAAWQRCARDGLVLARPDDAVAAPLRKYIYDTHGLANPWVSGRGSGTALTWRRDGVSVSGVARVQQALVVPGERSYISTDRCLALVAWESALAAHPTAPYTTELCVVTLTVLCQGIGWGPWSSWGSCSRSCGGGQQSRSRTCMGGECVTGDIDYANRLCGTAYCPVHGGWGAWSHPSACSVTCGKGQSQKTRVCNNPSPLNGGRNCGEKNVEIMECIQDPCPINGKWSEWSTYGECSTSCGRGVRSRSRSCTRPRPANGGQSCPGQAVDNASCNITTCPVDGGWSPWSEFGNCSQPCDDGRVTRHRTCTRPIPSNGGRKCVGDDQDWEPCHIKSCMITDKSPLCKVIKLEACADAETAQQCPHTCSQTAEPDLCKQIKIEACSTPDVAELCHETCSKTTVCSPGMFSVPGTKCLKIIFEELNRDDAKIKCEENNLQMASVEEEVAVELRLYILKTYGNHSVWLDGNEDSLATRRVCLTLFVWQDAINSEPNKPFLTVSCTGKHFWPLCEDPASTVANGMDVSQVSALDPTSAVANGMGVSQVSALDPTSAVANGMDVSEAESTSGGVAHAPDTSHISDADLLDILGG